ncbi:hypothetical protein MDA_GLEAN10020539 [Myotis davidii]|uniref:Uncharacterized protein n=1 Tax=Myotis davidii TaxID=225400 RepID=L5LDF3_MYODS|nr:hypothetical protein MDA_GLEAN10020539 [Myotis davidii]
MRFTGGALLSQKPESWLASPMAVAEASPASVAGAFTPRARATTPPAAQSAPRVSPSTIQVPTARALGIGEPLCSLPPNDAGAAWQPHLQRL